mmetsp:Transcript_72839/g.126439  ORF Transcript_72839/g.126439 Transcript_72839/m.126439 type:complete len:114 (-) Transcript_72839:56-397(-)
MTKYTSCLLLAAFAFVAFAQDACPADDMNCQAAEASMKVDETEAPQDVQLLQVGLSTKPVDNRLGGPKQAMIFDGNGNVIDASQATSNIMTSKDGHVIATMDAAAGMMPSDGL